MKKQTAEMEDLVRKAEKESEKIRQEKMSIMQRWTLSVINISKRDEALVNFRSIAIKGCYSQNYLRTSYDRCFGRDAIC
jgi:hypothetical protein